MKFRRKSFEQRRRRAREVVPFVFFLADGEKADAGIRRAEDHTRIDIAHDGELRQHLRLAIDVRPDIDDDYRVRPVSEGNTVARAGRSTPGTTP